MKGLVSSQVLDDGLNTSNLSRTEQTSNSSLPESSCTTYTLYNLSKARPMLSLNPCNWASMNFKHSLSPIVNILQKDISSSILYKLQEHCNRVCHTLYVECFTLRLKHAFHVNSVPDEGSKVAQLSTHSAGSTNMSATPKQAHLVSMRMMMICGYHGDYDDFINNGVGKRQQ